MKTRKFRSVATSPGIAIGKAFRLQSRSTPYVRYWVKNHSVEEEIIRFKNALRKSREQLETIQGKMCKFQGHDQIKILESHRMFLQDDMLVQSVIDNIREHKINAEWALDKTLANLKLSFLNVDEIYFRERQQDIDYVGRRIMDNLMGKTNISLSELPDGDLILIVRDLSPAEVANLAKEKVKGFLMEGGGETSHTAIISKALEIPALFGVKGVFDEVVDDEVVIIDGMKGIAIASPSAKERDHYVSTQENYLAIEQILMQDTHLPGSTNDGFKIRIEGNMELVEEISSLINHGAEGIGLYRTEYLFLNRLDEPSEEEQFKNYVEVLERLAPRPVTIRTIDLGGDKMPLGQGYELQANPALGLRAIRLCLKEIPIFKAQLRALLRASRYGNLKILLPMISSMEEIIRAKEIINEVKADLDKQKIAYEKNIPIGIMIEIPSAVMMANEMAKEVDFFSIGTNDLVQYSLAIDRINEHVSHLYNPFHPAVLRMIHRTVRAAKKAGIPVSLCGELAGDPLAISLMVGMELDSLSMNPISIPRVKKILRSISKSQLEKLVPKILTLSTGDEVLKYLKRRTSGILPGEVKKLHIVGS